MSPRTFTRRGSRASKLLAFWAAAVLCTTVLTGLNEVPASSTTTTVQAVSAKHRGHIVVTGVAANAHGKILRHAVINASIYGQKKGKALAHDRTNARGQFRLVIARTKGLHKRARHNGNVLNIELDVANRHNTLFVRALPVSYSHSAHHFQKLRLRKTPHWRPSAKGKASFPDELGGVSVFNASVAFMEAAPHEMTTITWKSEYTHAVKAGFGTGWLSWLFSGSVSIGNTSAAGQVNYLRAGRHGKAVTVTAPVEGQIATSCLNLMTYGMVSGHYCHYTPHLQWTGDLNQSSTTFHSCYDGPRKYRQKKSSLQTISISQDQGATYSDDVDFGAYGGDVNITNEYGAGSTIDYNLDQDGKKHLFCMVGANGPWPNDSHVYFSAWKGKDGPTGGGGGGCVKRRNHHPGCRVGARLEGS